MSRHQKMRDRFIQILLARGIKKVDGKPVERLTDRALLKAVTERKI